MRRPRPVQRSANWLNRTQGPVQRSQYFLLNRTEPDFHITRSDTRSVTRCQLIEGPHAWVNPQIDHTHFLF